MLVRSESCIMKDSQIASSMLFPGQKKIYQTALISIHNFIMLLKRTLTSVSIWLKWLKYTFQYHFTKILTEQNQIYDKHLFQSRLHISYQTDINIINHSIYLPKTMQKSRYHMSGWVHWLWFSSQVEELLVLMCFVIYCVSPCTLVKSYRKPNSLERVVTTDHARMNKSYSPLWHMTYQLNIGAKLAS